MPADIDFYFDFISPYSYLASIMLPRLADEHAAAIRYRPVCLLDLMQRVGNRPTTIECASKGVYAIADLHRWAARHQIAFAPSPYWQGIDFPLLGRGLLVAIDEGRGPDYIRAVYPAVYGTPVDLGRRAEFLRVLGQAGFDGAALLARAGAEPYVARLRANTEEAAERGVFGSPTMFIDGEMFFGNDRLDFVAEALRAAA
jgi:2-hydroxychromene-2-carboxylate isomerase